MPYDLKKVEISDLKDIMKYLNNIIYYRYDEIDFYYRKNNNSNRLVITFHGAITRTDPPFTHI